MLSKAISLLVLAACVFAGPPTADGIYYQITNVATQTTARVDDSGGPIYVPNTNSDPGPFQEVSANIGHFPSNTL